MPEIKCTLACNLDNDLISASLPLLEESRVNALEWSFDTLYNHNSIPEWFMELLKAYSHEGCLVGHGVFFSIFSGRLLQPQREWLKHLAALTKTLKFDHISEHFGFMTGNNFHSGAPLPIPYNATTITIGQDRLARIYDACHCPVGLENLAFSFSIDEVKKHGEFLEKLLEPINGFIILDLHNLYCQLHNFKMNFDELIKLYPLHRVREIHISGGSWEASEMDSKQQIRRDTHDDAVPNEVFDLLNSVIPRCPQLKYVVLEQLGVALKTPESKKSFYADFIKMSRIVSIYNSTASEIASNTFLPQDFNFQDLIVEDEALYREQLVLSEILETSNNYQEVSKALKESCLSGTDWKTESWDPHMINTAARIAQKWK